MSGLVFNENQINKDDIKTKEITILRINKVNMGVRLWFQILTDDDIFYQRWSMLMNNTDEILVLCQPGDKLNISYVEDHVKDFPNNTFEPFDRNVILTAKFV